MCSYNQINNSYGCQNSHMLNNLLKGELGFQGFVMSDWQAQHSGVSTALAGLDMSMPGDTEFNSGYSFCRLRYQKDYDQSANPRRGCQSDLSCSKWHSTTVQNRRHGYEVEQMPSL